MQENLIQRVSSIARRRPVAIVGKKGGEVICEIPLSRAARAGLNSFVPRTLLEGFRGQLKNSNEFEAMSEALNVLRSLQKYRCDDVAAKF